PRPSRATSRRSFSVIRSQFSFPFLGGWLRVPTRRIGRSRSAKGRGGHDRGRDASTPRAAQIARPADDLACAYRERVREADVDRLPGSVLAGEPSPPGRRVAAAADVLDLVAAGRERPLVPGGPFDPRPAAA